MTQFKTTDIPEERSKSFIYISGEWLLYEPYWLGLMQTLYNTGFSTMEPRRSDYHDIHAVLRENGLYLTYQYQLRIHTSENEPEGFVRAVKLMRHLVLKHYLEYQDPAMIFYRKADTSVYRFTRQHTRLGSRLNIGKVPLENAHWIEVSDNKGKRS